MEKIVRKNISRITIEKKVDETIEIIRRMVDDSNKEKQFTSQTFEAFSGFKE